MDRRVATCQTKRIYLCKTLFKLYSYKALLSRTDIINERFDPIQWLNSRALIRSDKASFSEAKFAQHLDILTGLPTIFARAELVCKFAPFCICSTNMQNRVRQRLVCATGILNWTRRICPSCNMKKKKTTKDCYVCRLTLYERLNIQDRKTTLKGQVEWLDSRLKLAEITQGDKETFVARNLLLRVSGMPHCSPNGQFVKQGATSQQKISRFD
jgi:hypothetical protein